MRMSDLKKGTVYAWKVGGSSDIRRLENFIRVEYIGPTPARYDKFRPDKKLNKGTINVKMLQEHTVYDRWNSDNRKVYKVGDTMEVDAKSILISWDALVEAAGETHAAALQAEAYMQSLKDLLKEVAPELTIDHTYWHSSRDKADVEVNLRHGETDKEFDPTDADISMKAETFRKLLQGVAS